MLVRLCEVFAGENKLTTILENVKHCGGECERVRMWQRMAFAKRSMKLHVTEMEAEKTAMVLVATSTIH